MTLAELLAMYESSLQAFAARTTATRRSIVNVFKCSPAILPAICPAPTRWREWSGGQNS